MTAPAAHSSDAKAGANLEKWSVQLEEGISKDLAARPIPFVGDGKKPVRHVEQLQFDNVKLATRSYK